MKMTPIALRAAALLPACILGAGMALAGTDRSEMALFGQARIDAAAAIAAAETATGGRAIEAEFDEDDGIGLWEVETVAGTTRTETRIDAGTGKVIDSRNRSEPTGKTQPVTPGMPGAPLADLVARAEAEQGGKVRDIELRDADAQPPGVRIDLVAADGTPRRILIGTDGKALALPADDDGDDD